MLCGAIGVTLVLGLSACGSSPAASVATTPTQTPKQLVVNGIALNYDSAVLTPDENLTSPLGRYLKQSLGSQITKGLITAFVPTEYSSGKPSGFAYLSETPSSLTAEAYRWLTSKSELALMADHVQSGLKQKYGGTVTSTTSRIDDLPSVIATVRTKYPGTKDLLTFKYVWIYSPDVTYLFNLNVERRYEAEYLPVFDSIVGSFHTAAHGQGVYRNAKMGVALRYDPEYLAVDDSSSSTFMTFLRTQVLPNVVGKGGVNARMGGLVAFAPVGWSSMAQGPPPGYALIWREPALVKRSQFGLLSTESVRRKICASVEATLRSTFGSDVTAVPTHVGHHPAVMATIRATMNGEALSVRWLWLYTPTSEYAFYGYADRSDESKYFPLFDQITNSITVSK